jgi:hypothetical protein
MKTQNQTPEKNNLHEVGKNQTGTIRKQAEGKSEQDYDRSVAKADGLKKTPQQNEKTDPRVKTTEKGRLTTDRESEKQDAKSKSNKDGAKH